MLRFCFRICRTFQLKRSVEGRRPSGACRGHGNPAFIAAVVERPVIAPILSER
jgi:hypothetical protein